MFMELEFGIIWLAVRSVSPLVVRELRENIFIIIRFNGHVSQSSNERCKTWFRGNALGALAQQLSTQYTSPSPPEMRQEKRKRRGRRMDSIELLANKGNRRQATLRGK